MMGGWHDDVVDMMMEMLTMTIVVITILVAVIHHYFSGPSQIDQPWFTNPGLTLP